MPIFERKELCGNAVAARDAAPWRFGDLQCPHCGSINITPDYARIVAGLSRCSLCKKPFRVTKDVALKCNQLQDHALKTYEGVLRPCPSNN
jgi:transposase-like protein